MTAFFVAGIEDKGKRTEDAYSELRERSLAVVGCPARSRRIFKLSCRFDGSDTEIEVGRRLAYRRSSPRSFAYRSLGPAPQHRRSRLAKPPSSKRPRVPLPTRTLCSTRRDRDRERDPANTSTAVAYEDREGKHQLG
jgi:hypothetical protein